MTLAQLKGGVIIRIYQIVNMHFNSKNNELITELLPSVCILITADVRRSSKIELKLLSLKHFTG